MKKLTIFARAILALVMSLAAIAIGQDNGETRRLTLSDCIRLAQSKSPGAKMVQYAYDQQYWQYQSSQALYLPQFSLSVEAPGVERAINAIDQDDGTRRFVAQSRAFSAAMLRVSQRIPWTGGNLFIASGLQRIDLFGNIDSFIWQSTPLSVQFRQPLFQFNPYKWNRRADDLQYRIAEKEYVEEMEDIAINITSDFFELYLAQMNVENASFNVSINDSIYTISQGRYKVGKIAENDLLQSELQLLGAQTQLANAKLEYERTAQQLKTSLGLPAQIKIEITPPAEAPQISVDPAMALEQANQNRSDLLSYDLQQTNAERDLAQAKSDAGLSAQMTATFGYNQSGENIPDLYQDLLDQQFFNISFQFPLFEWGRGNAEVEAARAEQKRIKNDIALKEEEFNQEVYFQVREFHLLQKQLSIAAKADTIAIRRFEVAKNRYLIGKIDITDLFDAQQAKDAARRQYIQTLRNYWVLFYRLRRLTLYDFENDQPLEYRL